jgi:hypothetical protein
MSQDPANHLVSALYYILANVMVSRQKMSSAVTAAGGDEKEAFVHSFHLDVRQNPEQKALLEGVARALAGTLGKAGQHVSAWQSLNALWTADKAATVKQLKVVHLCHISGYLAC